MTTVISAIPACVIRTVNNLETADENLTYAVSRIQDTDMAEEITEYTQQNVLSQSALQMLIKSNENLHDTSSTSFYSVLYLTVFSLSLQESTVCL